MEKNIAVIKGDGIGPEIVTEAMKVLDKVAAKFGHKFNYEQLLMGGCSIDANGVFSVLHLAPNFAIYTPTGIVPMLCCPANQRTASHADSRSNKRNAQRFP